MMNPMMPPATGPTGALSIMFKDATSSSGKQRGERGGRQSFQGQYPFFYDLLLLRWSSLTHEAKAICIGTLCTNDAPKTLFLEGTIWLVQLSLAITVNRAPLAVQHAETVTGENECEIIERNKLKKGFNCFKTL